MPPGRVLWRHVLKPSLRSVAAVLGLVFGNLLSGSFVVEIVTSWPGLGRLMFDALRSRDLYLVAGCAAAGGVFLALGALVSDVALLASTRGCAGGKRCAGEARRHRAGRVHRVLAVLAPALSPNPPDVRFPDRAYAPPMPVRVVDADGRWRAPFVYPIRLVDRLERRYEEDGRTPCPSRGSRAAWWRR